VVARELAKGAVRHHETCQHINPAGETHQSAHTEVLPDHPTQEEALRFVVRDQLNVRQTEALVEQLAAGAGRPRRPRATRAADPETRALEDRFRDALQAKVKLTRRGERGRLVVEFFSADELDALYRRVVGEA